MGASSSAAAKEAAAPSADTSSTSSRRGSKSELESSALLGAAPPADGALEAGGAINIYDPMRCGYLMQYFAVGLIYGGMPATQYGFFVAYLNVPGYIYGAAQTISTFPWSFKIFFALLTDALPIGGYRRRPYMCIGWFIAFVFLVAISATPLPPPYYCRDGPDGAYNLSHTCNEAAASSGMPYAFLMLMVAIGYVMADVAADALTVTYARREPAAERGRTQTTAYLTREIGMICAKLLVGVGMNGREYNGTFESGLSFNAVCAILALPAFAMVPISWYLVEEPKVGLAQDPTRGNKGSTFEHPNKDPSMKRLEGSEAGVGSSDSAESDAPWTVRAYLSTAQRLLCSAALFEVVCYSFFSRAVGGIGSTAGPEIQRIWADVQNLQNQLFSIVGSVLFAIGLWLMRTKFLGASWRLVTAITLILTNIIDMPFTFLTIYNVVRNQYFFLEDGLIASIPDAMGFVVSTYVMVEIAEPGTEGVTYGILTTASNIGGPVNSAISNWIFGYWQPSLSDSNNYVAARGGDTPAFRNSVAMSYVLSYAFAFAALLFLPLLPDQKADTQARKASRPRHYGFALATVGLIGIALVFSLTVSMLSIIPSTSCLEIAGGDGCDD